MKFKDYYETLGIDRKASQDEIQKAFRKLARKYHPDVNKTKEAEDRFKEINEANEVLSDPEKRKRYDMLGANWREGQEFKPPPGWDQRGGSFQFNHGEGGGLGGFSDFFDAIFGGSGAFGGASPFGGMESGAQKSAFARRPQHQEAELEISVDDSINGATKSIQVRDASGKVRSINVKIPAGANHGSTIRLAGVKGEPDLFLKIKIAADSRYSAAGSDLLVKLPLSPWEAALGGKVDLVLPDGTLKVTIPAGAQSGSKLRVRGRGFSAGKEKRGDVLAEIKIVVPTSLSTSEREMYEKLASISRFNPRGVA